MTTCFGQLRPSSGPYELKHNAYNRVCRNAVGSHWVLHY